MSISFTFLPTAYNTIWEGQYDLFDEDNLLANPGTTICIDADGALEAVDLLDGTGKIKNDRLPASVMQFVGTYDIITNTPSLVNGTGGEDRIGDIYQCITAGARNFGDGIIEVFAGDWLIYTNSLKWVKAANAAYSTTQADARFLRKNTSDTMSGTLTVTSINSLGTTNTFDGAINANSIDVNGCDLGIARSDSLQVNGLITANGGIDTLGTSITTGAGGISAATVTTTGLTTAQSMRVTGLSSNGVVHTNETGNFSTSRVVNADVDPSAAIADTKLGTISTTGKVSNSATTATSTNTASTIVSRDGNGRFDTSGMTISAANVLEFGIGTTKEMNAGKIGYGTFGPNVLSIIGGGTALPRTVLIHDNLEVLDTLQSNNIARVRNTASGEKMMLHIYSTNVNNPTRSGISLGRFPSDDLTFASGNGVRITSGSGTGDNGASIYAMEIRNTPHGARDVFYALHSTSNALTSVVMGDNVILGGSSRTGNGGNISVTSINGLPTNTWYSLKKLTNVFTGDGGSIARTISVPVGDIVVSVMCAGNGTLITPTVTGIFTATVSFTQTWTAGVNYVLTLMVHR